MSALEHAPTLQIAGSQLKACPIKPDDEMLNSARGTRRRGGERMVLAPFALRIDHKSLIFSRFDVKFLERNGTFSELFWKFI